MKKAKIVTSVLLALVMMFSLGISAFAGNIDPKGTITIENPLAHQSYYLYCIFNLESYDKTNNAYSYTLNNEWETFATQNTIESVFITLEKSGEKYYVKWIDGADVNAFAKLAIAWAKEHADKIDIVDGVSTTTTEKIVFKDLSLGYYLVDSSVGSLCALTTNDPDAVVNEKNELSTIEKLVKEDSTNTYGKENTAQVGDTVSFMSEITLGEGAENLVVHDKMNAVLNLKADSFKVYIKQSLVEAKNYTVVLGENIEADEYHTKKGICTFDIRFNNDYISTLNKGTVIRIEYDAVLGWSEDELKSFNNDTWITFGDNLESTVSTTTTNTYSFDLLKTDTEGKVIGTAKFKLYDAQSNGNVIKLIAVSEDDEKGIYHYRVATSADTIQGDGAEIKAGYAYVYGLDKEVYYLQETKQPVGYNLLSERVKVDLTNGDIVADKTSNFYAENGSVLNSDVSDNSGLQIINKAGTVLPGTGGIGTTMFYALGGILVAAAGVLLITKTRMSRKPANH